MVYSLEDAEMDYALCLDTDSSDYVDDLSAAGYGATVLTAAGIVAGTAVAAEAFDLRIDFGKGRLRIGDGGGSFQYNDGKTSIDIYAVKDGVRIEIDSCPDPKLIDDAGYHIKSGVEYPNCPTECTVEQGVPMGQCVEIY